MMMWHLVDRKARAERDWLLYMAGKRKTRPYRAWYGLSAEQFAKAVEAADDTYYTIKAKPAPTLTYRRHDHVDDRKRAGV